MPTCGEVRGAHLPVRSPRLGSGGYRLCSRRARLRRTSVGSDDFRRARIRPPAVPAADAGHDAGGEPADPGREHGCSQGLQRGAKRQSRGRHTTLRWSAAGCARAGGHAIAGSTLAGRTGPPPSSA